MEFCNSNNHLVLTELCMKVRTAPCWEQCGAWYIQNHRCCRDDCIVLENKIKINSICICECNVMKNHTINLNILQYAPFQPDVLNMIIWLGTNLIHDFTAVTFSVKLAFFREKRPFPCFREIRDFSWILTLLLSFKKVFSFINSFCADFAVCYVSHFSSK